MSTPRICATCKHFKRDWVLVTLAVVAALTLVLMPIALFSWVASAKFAKCKRKSVDDDPRDFLVTGRRRKTYYFCSTERAHYGDCSHFGRYWERRVTHD